MASMGRRSPSPAALRSTSSTSRRPSRWKRRISPQAQIPPGQLRIFFSFPGNLSSYLAAYNDAGTMRAFASLMIDGVRQYIGLGPALSVGSWSHVALTYDGAELTQVR